MSGEVMVSRITTAWRSEIVMRPITTAIKPARTIGMSVKRALSKPPEAATAVAIPTPPRMVSEVPPAMARKIS